jgi:hypothetical protein
MLGPASLSLAPPHNPKRHQRCLRPDPLSEMSRSIACTPTTEYTSILAELAWMGMYALHSKLVLESCQCSAVRKGGPSFSLPPVALADETFESRTSSSHVDLSKVPRASQCLLYLVNLSACLCVTIFRRRTGHSSFSIVFVRSNTSVERRSMGLHFYLELHRQPKIRPFNAPR